MFDEASDIRPVAARSCHPARLLAAVALSWGDVFDRGPQTIRDYDALQ